jgi:hypothetical protein
MKDAAVGGSSAEFSDRVVPGAVEDLVSRIGESSWRCPNGGVGDVGGVKDDGPRETTRERD